MADFTPAGMFPEDAKVYIQRKGSTAVEYTTRVSNFSEGGATKDVEKVDFFGGASLTVKKPQEILEVGFETAIRDTDWAYIFSGTQTTAGSAIKVTNDGDQTDYKIKVEWREPLGSSFYKIIYYNAVGVTLEKEWAADGYLKGTLNFKLSPTDVNGSGQRYEIECFDMNNTVGSGSYNSWETTANTLFGYT